MEGPIPAYVENTEDRVEHRKRPRGFFGFRNSSQNEAATEISDGNVLSRFGFKRDSETGLYLRARPTSEASVMRAIERTATQQEARFLVPRLNVESHERRFEHIQLGERVTHVRRVSIGDTENAEGVAKKTGRAAKWFTIAGIGNTINEGIEFVLNVPFAGWLADFAIKKWGPAVGGPYALGIFSAVALGIDILKLLFISATKTDWLGTEALRRMRQPEEGRSWPMRQVHRIAKRGDLLAFLTSSIFLDPVWTMLYMHRGEPYKYANGRNLGVYTASSLVGNSSVIGSWFAFISLAGPKMAAAAAFVAANPWILFLGTAAGCVWGLHLLLSPGKKQKKS